MFTISAQPYPTTGGLGVAVSKIAARRLETAKHWELECEVFAGESLTGERVAEGAEVAPGTLLVGKIAPRLAPEEQSPEERKLGRIFGDRGPTRDASLLCPPDAGGVVERVVIEDRRVVVVIAAKRELAIGDVLRLDDGREEVVAAIPDALEDGAELAWPGVSGTRFVEKIASAADVVHARSIGPYSIVTQQPLGGKASFGGQRVEAEQLELLLERGAYWTAHELMTVKSDDVQGRVKLYESIVRGVPECVSTLPRATRVLERELLALGFDVDFEAEQVEISLLDDGAIRARMPGEVVKAETINYRTHAPEPGGLFCEEIFGARDSDERATLMGHLELPTPALHPLCFELAATLLALPAKVISGVLYGESTLKGESPESWRETGAHAVRTALQKLDLYALAREAGGGARADLARVMIDSRIQPERLCFETWPVLPPDLRPLVPLAGGRFATSDLNDLYRQLINRANRLRRLLELSAPEIILINEAASLQRSLDALVQNGLRQKKIKHDGRPLVSLIDMIQGPKGTFRANLLGKRADYSAIAHVVSTTAISAEQVLIPRASAIELFRPWIYESLERQGHVNTIKEAKKLVGAGDPRALEALHEVAIGYPVLLFARARGAGFELELWEESAFGLAPAAIDLLGIRGPTAATLHVPIDPRAIEEVKHNLRRSRPRLVEAENPGWIARTATAEQVGPILVEAAIRREIDRARDARARTILGRRSSDTIDG